MPPDLLQPQAEYKHKSDFFFFFLGHSLRILVPHAHARSFQSCPALCDPMEYRLPGSSVQGILQARILEWVARPSFRGSSQPRDQTHVSWFGRRFFTTSTALVPQPGIRPMRPCCESAVLTTRPPGELYSMLCNGLYEKRI